MQLKSIQWHSPMNTSLATSSFPSSSSRPSSQLRVRDNISPLSRGDLLIWLSYVRCSPTIPLHTYSLQVALVKTYHIILLYKDVFKSRIHMVVLRQEDTFWEGKHKPPTNLIFYLSLFSLYLWGGAQCLGASTFSSFSKCFGNRFFCIFCKPYTYSHPFLPTLVSYKKIWPIYGFARFSVTKKEQN